MHYTFTGPPNTKGIFPCAGTVQHCRYCTENLCFVCWNKDVCPDFHRLLPLGILADGNAGDVMCDTGIDDLEDFDDFERVTNVITNLYDL